MLTLYKFLQSKIQITEIKLSSKLEARLGEDYATRLFYFELIILNIQLVFWQIVTDNVKFIVILFSDPGDSFNLFFRQRELKSCPYSYHQFKAIRQRIRLFSVAGATALVVVSVTTSLITNFLFGGKLPGQAATFGWNQSGWSGGATTTVATHASNRTGWNYYLNASSSIKLVGSTVQVATSSASKTQTSDADFLSAVASSSVLVNGSGAAGNVQLNKLSSADTWSVLANTPLATQYATGLAYDSNGNFYALAGWGGTGFWKYSIASNTWVTKANLPSPGATLGASLAYDGNGGFFSLLGGNSNAFYRYDIAANNWTAKANFPVNYWHGSAMAFDGNGNMFAFQGEYNSTFYQYNIASNVWTSKADFGVGVYNGGSLVSDGNGNIFGLPGNGSSVFKKYNIAANTWTPVADTPVTVNNTDNVLTYDGNGNIYLGPVTGGGFYKYNIAANSWTAKASGLSCGNHCGALAYDYNGSVYSLNGNLTNSFRKYNINDVFANSGTIESATIDLGAKSFLTTLNYSSSTPAGTTLQLQIATADAVGGPWVYVGPNGATSTYFTTPGQAVPASLNQKRYFRYKAYLSGGGWSSMPVTLANVGHGGASVYDNNGNVYVTQGGYNYGFYKYNIASGTWSTKTNVYSHEGGGIAYDNKGYIYYIAGNTASLNRYSIAANTWTSTGPPYMPSTHMGAGMSFGYNGNIYAPAGYSGSSFYLYNTASNTWTSLSPVPSGVYNHSATAYDGNGNMFMFAANDSATFYKYNLATNAWSTMAPAPAVTNDGASLAYDFNGNIYAFRGRSTTEFWRYSITSNTWTVMTNAPANVYDGGSLTYDMNGNLYAFRGNNTNAFWRYSINNNATPILNDVTLNYNYYATSSYLTSSAYDTTDGGNLLSDIQWVESLATGTDITFQLRTSPDGSSWTEWYGPTGTTTSYTDYTGAAEGVASVLGDGSNDKWIQYRTRLTSAGDYTPTLSGVTLTYVVNVVPELYIATTTPLVLSATGSVAIDYAVRDTDSITGTKIPGEVVIRLQYCTANCAATGTEVWATADAATISGQYATTSVDTASSTNYTNYSLLWNAKANYPDQYNGANFKVRLSADDTEGANNISYSTSNYFILDTKNPILGATPVIVDARANPATVTLSATDNSTFAYKLWTDLDAYDPLSDNSAWPAYLANATMTLPTGPLATTVYAAFRDAYNNITTTSTTLPEQLLMTMIQDTSNVKTAGQEEYRLFISWKRPTSTPVHGFRRYDIYRATAASGPYSLIATTTVFNVNYFTDVDMPSVIDVWYKAAIEDNDGNISYLSDAMWGNANGIQDRGEGGGGAGTVPPVISSIATSSVFTTQATVSWDTDMLSDSVVYYQTGTSSCDFSAATSVGLATMVNNAAGLGRHQVTITSLLPNTTYYFQARSTGAGGVTGLSTCDTLAPAFTTQSGPSIVASSTQVTSVANNTVDIAWETDQNADSYVVFSTNPTMAGSVELGSSDSVMSHAVTLFGLNPGTKYYFYVKSSNARDDNSGNYFTFTTTRDLTPPTISNITSSATNNSAVIQFATAKPATTTVILTTSDETWAMTIDTLNTAHRFDFAGLTAATIYSIAIEARDANGNTDTDNTATTTTLAAPDTTAPTIATSSDFIVTSQTNAVITWTTPDETATGYVEYATTNVTSTFESTYKQVGRSDLSNSHVVAIDGLTANQTYYFRIRSTDASGNTTVMPAAPDFYSFSAIVQPLAISNVATSTITDTSAVITWSTNHQSDSSVIYGTQSDTYTLNQANAASTTEHTIILNGLASTTQYFFRVVSNDALGQTATSSEYSFTTADAPIDPAAYQDKLDQIDALLTQIAALQATASSTGSADAATISSLQSQVASLQQQLAAANAKGGGGTLIIDKTDKVAPKISNIKTDEVKAESARISWTTDEASNSFVSYGTGTTSGSFGDWQNVTNHSAELKGLVPATTYSYKVASMDASGNLSVSSDQTFTTPTLEAQLKDEGKTDEEIKKLTEEAASKEENKTNILLAAAAKAMEIMSQVANQVSLGTLETTLLTQFDTIEKLAGSIPGPILGGEPLVVTGATTATISWNTDKNSNSMVSYAPEGSYLQGKYIQTVGEANDFTKAHQVKVSGLKPDTTYHYQLRSKAPVGPESKSRDFVFTTREETLEIVNSSSEVVSAQEAVFRWATNIESVGQLIITPYHSGKLAVEESQTIDDKARSTRHEARVKDIESGIIYKVAMKAVDDKKRTAEEIIDPFTTSKDDLPPQITNVQTESALSQGKQLKVQTIVSWQTNEPTVGQVQYVKGVVTDDKEFPDKTALETTYSRKHVAVVTKFDSGTVYTFRITATDSSGNKTTSKVYTILTPKQKESVFQLILKNFEDIFGWVGKVGN